MAAEEGTAPGRWFTPLRAAMALIAVGVWAIVIVIAVDLVNKYLDSGRKEKTSLTRVKQQHVEFPWVIVIDAAGSLCKVRMTGCAFSHAARGTVENCNDIIHARQVDLNGDMTGTFILNQTRARSQNFVFETGVDFLVLLFQITKNDPVTNTTQLVANGTQCQVPGSLFDYVMLLPIADTAVMERVGQGTSEVHDFGTPVYAGLNHLSLLSFSLSQERFVDGRVVNTTSFKNTQIYTPLSPLGFSILVQPDGFLVSQVKHLQGDSVVTLLGSVFGWVGVLTGTSIQGFLLAVAAFSALHASKAREKYIQEKEDALLANEVALLASAEHTMCPLAAMSRRGVATDRATVDEKLERLRHLQHQLDELVAVVQVEKRSESTQAPLLGGPDAVPSFRRTPR